MSPRDRCAELLKAEIKKLDVWLETQQCHLVYENIRRIREKLYAAIALSPYLYDYLEDAFAINRALQGKDDENYSGLMKRAEMTVGASSPQRKMIGAAMMMLGIGLLALAWLVMTTILPCTFLFTPFILLTLGTGGLAVGISFFRSGCQSNMASQLENLTTTFSKNRI